MRQTFSSAVVPGCGLCRGRIPDIYNSELALEMASCLYYLCYHEYWCVGWCCVLFCKNNKGNLPIYGYFTEVRPVIGGPRSTARSACTAAAWR
jgi:hypothetical protein